MAVSSCLLVYLSHCQHALLNSAGVSGGDIESGFRVSLFAEPLSALTSEFTDIDPQMYFCISSWWSSHLLKACALSVLCTSKRGTLLKQ